jgi:hypothetical protein
MTAKVHLWSSSPNLNVAVAVAAQTVTVTSGYAAE